MLAKKYRLSRKQIGFIHKRGRRLGLEKISVKFSPNRLDFSRFAVNVPTSVYKNATDRNRLRRIVYDEIGKMKMLSPYDCLINIYSQDSEEKIRQKTREILSGIR